MLINHLGRDAARFLMILASSMLAGVRLPPARGGEVLESKPTEGILLLDDHTVASTKNVTQQFFPATRHPANPVMTRTEPWEGVGPYVWGNRLMQDEASRQLRLWYIAYDFSGNFYRWGYATSDDGLAWTKPALGVERFGDALATNCLPLGPHPEKGTRSIVRDPRPETPSHRRYLGMRFTYEGEFASFSPDGVAWLEYPLNPVWRVPSDIIHIMWDERRERFVAFFKVWELAGTELVAEEAGAEGADRAAAAKPLVGLHADVQCERIAKRTGRVRRPLHRVCARRRCKSRDEVVRSEI